MTTTPDGTSAPDGTTAEEKSHGLAAAGFADDAASASLGDSFQAYRDRLRGGDMGALPAVLGPAAARRRR